LPPHVIDRVSSGRLCALNQCLAKTDFFHFLRLDAVTGNVIDSICRPGELVNLHSLILPRDQQPHGLPRLTGLATRRRPQARFRRAQSPRLIPALTAQDPLTHTGLAPFPAEPGHLGNLWRRLALPQRIGTWSLTSLQQRLVKTGARLIKHARYYWLLLAESHLTRRLFGSMVRPTAALPLPTG
jgi:hypothetical protein